MDLDGADQGQEDETVADDSEREGEDDEDVDDSEGEEPRYSSSGSVDDAVSGMTGSCSVVFVSRLHGLVRLLSSM